MWRPLDAQRHGTKFRTLAKTEALEAVKLIIMACWFWSNDVNSLEAIKWLYFIIIQCFKSLFNKELQRGGSKTLVLLQLCFIHLDQNKQNNLLLLQHLCQIIELTVAPRWKKFVGIVVWEMHFYFERTGLLANEREKERKKGWRRETKNQTGRSDKEKEGCNNF